MRQSVRREMDGVNSAFVESRSQMKHIIARNEYGVKNPPCAKSFFRKTSRVTENFQPRDAKKFQAALLRFDTENSRDPNL